MPAYRYISQHALTGEILSWDLPLSDVEFGPELNGPGSLRAVLEPHLAQLVPPDAGNALLYAERDQRLLWGGLVWRAEPVEGKYPIEASGFSSYLARRRDLHGDLAGRGPYIGADPSKVIQDVWAYCQEQPDGDLGVQVDSRPSSLTVGTKEQPYSTKAWEAPALAAVVRDMTALDQGPEFTETVDWVDGAPQRRVIVGWPRLGTRRSDISFATGINVTGSVPVLFDADQYAQVVVGLGAGEGSAKVRTTDAARNNRLRLESVLDAPGEKSSDRLAARVRAERARRQRLGELTAITVVDHPAAPVGSWSIGDDVRVTVHDQWGDWDGWCRITAWTLHPAADGGQETATLRLARPYSA
ncbi:hypothetical protein [Kitasatospora sp. MBT63]|uniref:hypothetical protein n=1 Tax=Kitasatospora sp. MBT63 TaxID=1444768 RepID=UPI00053AEAD9|nr:hypothetical protein [Kitasatospora sp. MBT63]